MPKTPEQRIRLAKRLVRVQLGLTLMWLVLIIPTLLWWRESILWVAMMSIWANVASHASGYQAARAELTVERDSE